MGSLAQRQQRLGAIFPTIEWDDAGSGLVVGADFTLEIPLGVTDAIFSVSVYARGNATLAVLDLIAATGWRLLDIGTKRWLGTDADEGRQKYRALLDAARGQQSDAATYSCRKNWLARIYRR